MGRKRYTFKEVQTIAAEIGVTVTKGYHMDTPWGWGHTEYIVSEPYDGDLTYYERLDAVVYYLEEIKKYLIEHNISIKPIVRD